MTRKLYFFKTYLPLLLSTKYHTSTTKYQKPHHSQQINEFMKQYGRYFKCCFLIMWVQQSTIRVPLLEQSNF